MPTPDDTKRTKPAVPDWDDDDAELELEPPDAEVVAAEERRTREAIEATMMSIDVDEIYREAGRDHGGEILENWLRHFKFRFQFQVKHLLIATAVLAIVLTLWRLELLGTALMLLLMISVGGVYLYLQLQEKKQREEANRRRQEMYAQRRAYFDKLNRGPAPEGSTAPAPASTPPPPPLRNETDQARQEAAEGQKFRFQFSLKQLLAAMFAAAVILGFVQFMGGPAPTATMLGMLALAGLVIHALGFEPPEIIVLGWWMILVLYVLLSIVAAVWSGIA